MPKKPFKVYTPDKKERSLWERMGLNMEDRKEYPEDGFLALARLRINMQLIQAYLGECNIPSAMRESYEYGHLKEDLENIIDKEDNDIIRTKYIKEQKKHREKFEDLLNSINDTCDCKVKD